MGPRLSDGAITPTVESLLKGLLRTLLVLLHDFPDYLSENHFTLCNLIPPGCVQLKNLVLSAFPRMNRLPDPFMEGLVLENIIENKDPPVLSVDIPSILDGQKVRASLDRYLQSRAPEDFPQLLVERLRAPYLENGMQNGVKSGKDKNPAYNVDLLNAVVLYVGMHAIEASQKNSETGVLIFDSESPHMALFTSLNAEFDIEGLLF
jgi:CCR4-NOT transcription complex subunit 1